MNIAAALSSAADLLTDAAIAEPRREASSLLTFCLGRDAAFVIAHPEYELTAEERARFENALNRRASREPLQYITGRQQFWGLDLEVTPDVLIPRPETEILVEAAIGLLEPEQLEPRFCEAGIGSGCISIAILHSVPTATAVATDISAPALDVAGRNAARHGVSERLDLRLGDGLDGVSGLFYLIVSNPPYVPDRQIESLQAEVRDHEPYVALSGGKSGLDVITRVISGSPDLLTDGGHLLMEIGFDQSERVAELFDSRVWETPAFLDDLQGIPRIVTARYRG